MSYFSCKGTIKRVKCKINTDLFSFSSVSTLETCLKGSAFFDFSQEMMKYCDFYTFYLVLSNKIGTFAAENGTGSVTYPLFLFL